MVTPRVAILIARVALINVQLAAFTCAVRGKEVNFTAFMSVHIISGGHRLATCLF
jgi:hypothetical protein